VEAVAELRCAINGGGDGEARWGGYEEGKGAEAAVVECRRQLWLSGGSGGGAGRPGTAGEQGEAARPWGGGRPTGGRGNTRQVGPTCR
jgi:hypothetical protein